MRPTRPATRTDSAAMLRDPSGNSDGYAGTIMLGLELEGTRLADAIYANGFESA